MVMEHCQNMFVVMYLGSIMKSTTRKRISSLNTTREDNSAQIIPVRISDTRKANGLLRVAEA